MAETAGKSEQRVSCPSCGRLLFKIGLVHNPGDSCFEIEAKCKSGGCHKLVSVIYRHGKITLSLL